MGFLLKIIPLTLISFLLCSCDDQHDSMGPATATPTLGVFTARDRTYQTAPPESRYRTFGICCDFCLAPSHFPSQGRTNHSRDPKGAIARRISRHNLI
jgi:hypothetical protein